MNKGKFFGMKHLPLHELFTRGIVLFPPDPSESVHRVACDGVAGMGQVDPDLMSPPGLGTHKKESKTTRQFLLFLPSCKGASTPQRRYGHFLSSHRVTGNGKIKDSLIAPDDSMHNGDILFVHFPGLELGREKPMGIVVLDHDHETRSVFVEPVDNARPKLASDACEIPAMSEKSVNKRSVGVTGSRVNHHAGRLVDDHQE